MVNRVLEVKRIKMRRKNRKLRFDQTVVNLGIASLSHQKMGVGLRVPGRVPAKYSLNRERMSEINPRKDMVVDIRKSLQLPMSEDAIVKARVMLKDRDLSFNRCIFKGRTVKVYVIFNLRMDDIFLFQYNSRLDLIQRSCNFRSIEEAQEVFSRGATPWL